MSTNRNLDVSFIPADPLLRHIVGDSSAPSSGDPWQRTEARIAWLHTLRDDWDGEGAAAPTGDLINRAASLLAAVQSHGIAPPTTIAAGHDGAIVIEWHGEPYYFEIAFKAPNAVEWLATLNGKPAAHGTEVDEQAVRMLRLATARSEG